LDVGDEGLEFFFAAFEAGEDFVVAGETKESSDSSGDMRVVNGKPSFVWFVATDGAPSVLYC
jgi:hypothetical protein